MGLLVNRPARLLLALTGAMQEGFFQKVLLCAIIGACAAGMIEFYKNFVDGADRALNGGHQVHMHVQPPKN
jgi:hypothetical protein